MVREAVAEVLEELHFCLLGLLEVVAEGSGGGVGDVHGRKDYNGKESVPGRGIIVL